jgi:hypothetical protein
MKEGYSMEANNKCSCGKTHEEHICALHSKGLIDEVLHLTDNPTVTCSICLVNANSPDNVCSPTTLGGGFKYSDMAHNKKLICSNADTHSENNDGDPES